MPRHPTKRRSTPPTSEAGKSETALNQKRRQGRRKHQAIKQLSAEGGSTVKNVLLAIFGRLAQSPIYELASESVTVRALMDGLDALCAVVPERAQASRDQVDDVVRRLGRFIIETDVNGIREFLDARIALEEQGNKVEDPVRLLLIDNHRQLFTTLLRPPTVKELRAAVAKRRPGVSSMDESQFRRTCCKLGLQFTDEKKWNRFWRVYRELKTKAGRSPLADELFILAQQKGLPWGKLAREDFVALCLSDGMIVRAR